MSISQTGKTQSEETKLKRSQKLIGRKHSIETIQKRSKSLMGNTCALGRTVSADTRAKISEKNKGNKNAAGAVRSPEYLKAMSERFKGRVFSDEHRNKLSEAARKDRHNRYHVNRNITNPKCLLCREGNDQCHSTTAT